MQPTPSQPYGEALAAPPAVPVPPVPRPAASPGLTVLREQIDTLEDEWRQVLASFPVPSVFLSPTWLRTWWSEFADGRELLLLAVRDVAKLRAVVPLMRDGRALAFAGDTEICDYMDFGCLPGFEAEVAAAVLRELIGEPWDELVLWAVREDSPVLAALPAVCADLGLRFEVRDEDVCPQVALPAGEDGWEQYLAGMDKKDRHELRRKLRRLPQAGEVSLRILDRPEEMAEALDVFLPLYAASRAEKAAFLTDRMQRFLRRLLPALAAEGMAELTFLDLNHRPVAAVLCFRCDGQLLLYNSGYDPAYSAFSVGLLSKALTLKNAIERGFERFDFLRGAEPYKYDLGATDLRVCRCLISRP